MISFGEKHGIINRVTFNKTKYIDLEGKVQEYIFFIEYILKEPSIKQNLFSITRLKYRLKQESHIPLREKELLEKAIVYEFSLDEFNSSRNNRIKIYKDINNLPITSEQASIFFKKIKFSILNSKKKSWEDVLAKDIVYWAYFTFGSLVQKELEEFSYGSNYRVADIKKSSQMRRYRKQRNNSTSITRDCKLIGPDDRTYLLGYNITRRVS